MKLKIKINILIFKEISDQDQDRLPTPALRFIICGILRFLTMCYLALATCHTMQTGLLGIYSE